MNKKELRKIYKDRRIALTDKELARLDDLMLIRFQQAALPPSETLLSFWPIARLQEFDATLCAEFLSFRMPGLQLAFPRADFSTGGMQAIAVDETTVWQENEYGIPEPVDGRILPPESLDLIFMPLLCFDKAGFRVGYGKGFYDRFLKQCKPSATRIGFSYFEPVESIDDADEFDVPLSVGITPNRLYEF